MRLRGKKVLVSRKDVWNCDSTLSPIIAAVLRKFYEESTRVNHFGVPTVVLLDFDVPDEDVDLGFKKWQEILLDMIFAFEYNEYKSNKYWEAYSKTLETNFKEPDERGHTEVTITSDVNLEEKYRAEKDVLEKRKAKGLLYFTRYYDNLWW